MDGDMSSDSTMSTASALIFSCSHFFCGRAMASTSKASAIQRNAGSRRCAQARQVDPLNGVLSWGKRMAMPLPALRRMRQNSKPSGNNKRSQSGAARITVV